MAGDSHSWKIPATCGRSRRSSYEIKPDFIVETGTFKGGGALFYASILQMVNPKGKVITVDIKPQMEQAAKLDLFKDRVEFIEGSSTSDDVIHRIAETVKGSKVMVTLDSDHHMKHVLKELELYSGFVSPGSYLILQDTSHNGHPIPTNLWERPHGSHGGVFKNQQ